MIDYLSVLKVKSTVWPGQDDDEEEEEELVSDWILTSCQDTRSSQDQRKTKRMNK